MADDTTDAKKPVPNFNAIATVQRDITHWFYGNVMLPRDDTLLSRGGGRGLWIYDDIERDGQVLGVIRKRKMALTAYPWKVEPASSSPADKAAAEMIESHLKKVKINGLVVDQLDAIMKGFAVGEIMWAIDAEKNEVFPQKIIPRDQKRFKFTTDYALRLITFQNMLEGEELPDRKFIVHSVGAKDGNPYGLGLGSSLFWPALFKKMDITFWLTFNDKFGSPTAVGKYPQSAQQPEIDRLLNVLSAIAQDAGVTIPENMMIEYLEASRTGSVDAYERMARYMDEQISITVLGETLSTNVVGTGARAASETHNDVRLELTQADGEALAETLNNSLVKWDVEFNLPGAKPPLLSWETEAGEDLNQRAIRDTALYNMGFKPTLQYVTETYGGEWTEREMAAVVPGGLESDEPAAAFAEVIRRALAPKTPSGPTTADRFAARLAAEAADPIEAMVHQVRLLFGECSSLEEMRDRLLDIYPKLDAKSFATVMERAVTVSDLAGRYEAK